MRAILPILIGGDAHDLLLANLPFASTIGRITPLISSRLGDSFNHWRITDVAVNVAFRIYRAAFVSWEWQDRITFRIKAVNELNADHPIGSMMEFIQEKITAMLSQN